MKTAIIAVSRDGLNVANRLLDLYSQAAIYTPLRLLTDAISSAQVQDIIERNKKLYCSTCESESSINPVIFDGAAQENSLSAEDKVPKNSFPLEMREHEFSLPPEDKIPKSSLPLEGGGSGWGCVLHNNLHPLSENFSNAIATIFNQYQLLIFISAVAVAVRAIAPCLQGKDKDPAIVVIDDQSRFAISLLSGHLGGANEATGKIAHLLGACPVVTTATDNHGVTAFDNLARNLGWKLENLPDLKKISAALLEEKEIYIYSERPLHYPLSGTIRIVSNPEELQSAVNGYVLISSRLDPLPGCPPFPHIILRPCSIVAGVGCRRDISAAAIIRAVERAFARAGLSLSSLSCLATGEFKAQEAGLISAAAHFRVPLKIFTRGEIAAALGNSPQSTFVEKQVGVGAVAEPCAKLGSGGGPLLLEVQRGKGITVALSESPSFPTKP